MSVCPFEWKTRAPEYGIGAMIALLPSEPKTYAVLGWEIIGSGV